MIYGHITKICVIGSTPVSMLHASVTSIISVFNVFFSIKCVYANSGHQTYWRPRLRQDTLVRHAYTKWYVGSILEYLSINLKKVDWKFAAVSSLRIFSISDLSRARLIRFIDLFDRLAQRNEKAELLKEWGKQKYSFQLSFCRFNYALRACHSTSPRLAPLSNHFLVWQQKRSRKKVSWRMYSSQ